MLKAIKDRIIVKLDETENSSIILTDKITAQNKGIVMSKGELVTGIDIGDHIIFHQFDELPLPEKGMVVIRVKCLLGRYVK